ncbi:MAG: hypothetical protein ACYC5Q_13240 [Thermoleophilia bacterium]
MDPLELRGFELKFAEWLTQGYQIMADEIDGEIRVTTHFVARAGASGKERDQEFWPLLPELVDLLERNGIPLVRTMAGPDSPLGGC